MRSKMSLPEVLRSGRFRGLWVALDNCRYDKSTLQPVEGDVVDADEDLSELCERMREKGRTSCSILFCDEDVIVEQPAPGGAPVARTGAVR